MGRPPSVPPDKYLMLTLLLLDHESLGRYTLSTYLNMSKAKTRAILEYLTDLGWAKSRVGRGGTSLTTEGANIVDQLKKHCRLDWKSSIIEFSDELVPPQKEFAKMLLRTEDLSTNGLYERDTAVRQGAEGAITIVKKSGAWIFPDDTGTKAQQISIKNPAKVSPYNMLTISFGETKGVTFAGCAAIVMYHLADEISEILSS